MTIDKKIIENAVTFVKSLPEYEAILLSANVCGLTTVDYAQFVIDKRGIFGRFHLPEILFQPAKSTGELSPQNP